MKNRILVLSTIFILLGVYNNSFAQDAATIKVENAIKSKGKYAILVSNENHLRGGIMTGLPMKEKQPNIQYQVIVAGPVVKDLTHDEDLRVIVRKAHEANIPVVICAFAMQKLGVKREQLPKTIKVTSNAFVYMFGLEELGFKTLMP